VDLLRTGEGESKGRELGRVRFQTGHEEQHRIGAARAKLLQPYIGNRSSCLGAVGGD
jgi:hypothetical protein